MPRKHLSRRLMGCIAADVTAVALPRNGLTLGITEDRLRDGIRGKLNHIVDNAERFAHFDNCRGLQNYWFQVHFPALIMHPPSMQTRFFSVHLENPFCNREASRAMDEFMNAFQAASFRQDERVLPPRSLTPRTDYLFPKGATFSLDRKRIDSLRSSGELGADEMFEEIATLSFDNKCHHFTYFELCMALSQLGVEYKEILDDAEESLSHHANVIMLMYAQRFPYKEYDECDLDASE